MLFDFKQKLDESELSQKTIQINGVSHKISKLLKEVEVFTEILHMIPAHSLTDQEKQVILEELKLSLKPMQPYLKMMEDQRFSQPVQNVSMSASSSTSMVLMIFRFFI